MVQRFHVIYEGPKKFHTCIYSLRYLPPGGIAPSNFWQNSDWQNGISGYSGRPLWTVKIEAQLLPMLLDHVPHHPHNANRAVAVYLQVQVTLRSVHSVLRPRHGEEDVAENQFGGRSKILEILLTSTVIASLKVRLKRIFWGRIEMMVIFEHRHALPESV